MHIVSLGMRSITRKGEIKIIVSNCLERYYNSGVEHCALATHQDLLSCKVKFPLLEYAASLYLAGILTKDRISFCNCIAKQKTIGGNVLLGIMVQSHFDDRVKEAIMQAMTYIDDGAAWYVSDIIGERVVGKSLLFYPKETLKVVRALSNHKSLWVIRSLGAGGHYAIKKGLTKHHVTILFSYLVEMSKTKERQIKQGIGWAAKTTAKFHPDIIKAVFPDLEVEESIPRWFKTKIKIGLDRNYYAKTNHS